MQALRMARIVQANRRATNRHNVTVQQWCAELQFQNTQLIDLCHGWAIAADDHAGFHSYQLKTRRIDSSGHAITNTGQLRSGKSLPGPTNHGSSCVMLIAESVPPASPDSQLESWVLIEFHKCLFTLFIVVYQLVSLLLSHSPFFSKSFPPSRIWELSRLGCSEDGSAPGGPPREVYGDAGCPDNGAAEPIYERPLLHPLPHETQCPVPRLHPHSPCRNPQLHPSAVPGHPGENCNAGCLGGLYRSFTGLRVGPLQLNECLRF